MASPWVLECSHGVAASPLQGATRGWAAARGALGGGAECEEVGP